MRKHLKKLLLGGFCMTVLCFAACGKTDFPEETPTPTTVAVQPEQEPENTLQ